VGSPRPSVFIPESTARIHYDSGSVFTRVFRRDQTLLLLCYPVWRESSCYCSMKFVNTGIADQVKICDAGVALLYPFGTVTLSV